MHQINDLITKEHLRRSSADGKAQFKDILDRGEEVWKDTHVSKEGLAKPQSLLRFMKG